MTNKANAILNDCSDEDLRRELIRREHEREQLRFRASLEMIERLAKAVDQIAPEHAIDCEIRDMVGPVEPRFDTNRHDVVRCNRCLLILVAHGETWMLGPKFNIDLSLSVRCPSTCP